MSEIETSSPEVSTSTSSAPETAAPAETSAPETNVAPSMEAAAPVVPSFTPNFKFKVMDKEHEIPEFLRSAVKDEATQKQLIELHEKALGLDVVKPKYQSIKSQFDKISQEKATLDQSLTVLDKYLQNGDLDSFFKALKINEEQVLKYALDRVQYRELPPEQRMQYDTRRSEQQRLYDLEAQNQQLQSQFMTESVQARTFQLDSVLGRGDVKSVAEAYDAKVGRPGAFRAEVIKRGQYANYSTGADISAEQAVSEVVGMFGPLMQQAASPAQSGQSQASGAPSAPPVIPNINGRGTSPVKRTIKSIDDLRELAKNMA